MDSFWRCILVRDPHPHRSQSDERHLEISTSFSASFRLSDDVSVVKDLAVHWRSCPGMFSSYFWKLVLADAMWFPLLSEGDD